MTRDTALTVLALGLAIWLGGTAALVTAWEIDRRMQPEWIEIAPLPELDMHEPAGVWL